MAPALPLQTGRELAQGLQEVRGNGGGLLSEAPPPPAQLPLLRVAVLKLPEQRGDRLDTGHRHAVLFIGTTGQAPSLRLTSGSALNLVHWCCFLLCRITEPPVICDNKINI